MHAFFSKPSMMVLRYYRKLWLRVTLYAVLSLVVAGAGAFLGDLVPESFADRFDEDSVTPVLTILASAMLAVSTFSLNVMVSAHRAAAQNATPRIHRLLLDDTTTQSVLATFIGAFVFALTTITLLQAGAYPQRSMTLLMAVTALVVVLIIAAMLRWIDHLSTLGSLDETLLKLAGHTRTGLTQIARQPAMQGMPLTDEMVLPSTLIPVPAPRTGFIGIVDVARINACLSEDTCAYMSAVPGKHVLKGTPLLYVTSPLSEAAEARMGQAFDIGRLRSFEQDPTFGLTAISEVASKALSPGINDSGTAIQALSHLKDLLWHFANIAPDSGPAQFPRVFFPPLACATLVEAAFAGVARDGAGAIEVAEALRQTLLELAQSPNEALNSAARSMAERALLHADQTLPLVSDKHRLRTLTEDGLTRIP